VDQQSVSSESANEKMGLHGKEIRAAPSPFAQRARGWRACRLLLLLTLLLEFGGIQAEIGNRLLIKLPGRLQLLALLELLYGILGFAAPAPVRSAGLEAILVQRLLHLPYFTPGQVLG
jgi:hypothetical protein